jgi:heptosyltransferase-2
VTRTLVVQTAWLGDVLLATPLLEALAARHGPVDVLVTPAAAPLVATHPAVATVLTYDKRGRERGGVALWRKARALRARRYDLAVLAQGSFRSGLLARLAGIPRRVGFADTAAARWCTERRARPAGHEAERLLALAGAVSPPDPGPREVVDPAEAGPRPPSVAEATGASARFTGRSRPRARFSGIHRARASIVHEAPIPDARGPALSLALTDDDHATAAAALAKAGITGPFVALAPGSARATKRWPFYRELAALLAREMAVVVIGEPADGWGTVADLTGLPLRASAAVLARAAAAVVNDSAPLHLAQAVGTPVVALFGPTHPRLGFGPRGPRDVTLGLDLACRPCSTHGGPRCPLRHHRCLRELTVATVRDAVRRVLALEEVSCVS